MDSASSQQSSAETKTSAQETPAGEVSYQKALEHVASLYSGLDIVKTTMTIMVSSSFVGFHYWKDAPVTHAYLRNPHRHVFVVRVYAKVTHADRDIEFHALLDKLNRSVLHDMKNLMAFSKGGAPFSCETIANMIYSRLEDKRISKIEVLEDGECGGIVEYEPLKV